MSAQVATNNLSPTMRSALACAEKYGGKLIRYPGGYWAREGWMQNGDRSVSYGTSTIEALVARGKLTYTKWQNRKNWSPAFKDHEGQFPIEAALS